MDLNTICKNILQANEVMAKKEIMGIPIETCDTRLLEITEENMDEHVSMQPIAIAFWGVCYKQALRKCERIKRDYEMWRRSKYAAAKDAIQGKCTIAEVEAKIEEANSAEIKTWNEQVDNAEDQADLLESWYKGWSQKGYSIKEHANIQMDESYATGSIKSNNANRNQNVPPEPKESMEIRTQRIREMMRNKNIKK